MDKRHRAIVTGATGYVGSHVVRHLLKQGWGVSIIMRKNSNLEYIKDIINDVGVYRYEGNINSLIEYFKLQEADVVMHIAAAVITDPSPEQVPIIIDANIKFGTEVLEAMSHSSTRLFISTGTYWQNYGGTDEYNPVDLYAASKEAFEKIVKLYVEAYGFRHINLRLFDVYGEDDKRPKLWALLRDIAGTGKSFDITAGEQWVDMVYIDDVACAYEIAYNILEKDHSIRNEIYGVSNKRRYRLKNIINLFQTLLDKKLIINFGGRPYKKREVMSPFEGYLGLPLWQPRTSIKDGLSKYLSK